MNCVAVSTFISLITFLWAYQQRDGHSCMCALCCWPSGASPSHVTRRSRRSLLYSAHLYVPFSTCAFMRCRSDIWFPALYTLLAAHSVPIFWPRSVNCWRLFSGEACFFFFAGILPAWADSSSDLSHETELLPEFVWPAWEDSVILILIFSSRISLSFGSCSQLGTFQALV